MAATEPYLEIGDDAFPLVTRFTITDSVLIEEVTGLQWLPFLNRARDLFTPSDEDGDMDYVAFTGVVAIGVARKNPRWRRDRVRRFVEDIEHDAVRLVIPEAEPEGDADPPANGAGSMKHSKSASSSESDSASTSDQSSRETSGTQESPT